MRHVVSESSDMAMVNPWRRESRVTETTHETANEDIRGKQVAVPLHAALLL